MKISTTLLLFVCSWIVVLASPKTKLIRVPVKTRAINPSKLYQVSHRPWFTQYNSLIPANVTKAFFEGQKEAQAREFLSVPIEGAIVPVGEYYATLLFDNQPVRVQLDTGSSTTAVPLSQCTNCLPSDDRLTLPSEDAIVGCTSNICSKNSCYPKSCGSCSADKQCCSSQVEDGCSFELLYADRSGVTGTLVKTNVQVDGIYTDLIIGGMLYQDDFETKYVDGILGLSFKTLACNPSCVLPLVDTLYENKQIDHDIFSMCLNSEGGMLTIGGSDPSLYQNDLTYVPYSKTFDGYFYKVDIKSWVIGGETVDLPQISNAIVDSGTTLLIVSDSTYYAMRDYYQAHYCDVPGLCTSRASSRKQTIPIVQHPKYNTKMSISTPDSSKLTTTTHPQTWFAPGYCVALSESQVNLLPSMTVRLYGYDLTITPMDYMIPETINGRVYYCLGISPLSGMEYLPNDVIIGDTILQKYFVEYDRENARLGFAVANNCNDGSIVSSASEIPTNSDDGTSSSSSSDVSWFSDIFASLPAVIAYIIIIALIIFGASKFLRRSGYDSIQS